VATRALRRQAPKVGAVCEKAACTDLCGGTGATRFPTAITQCNGWLLGEPRRRRGSGRHSERPVHLAATGFALGCSTDSIPRLADGLQRVAAGHAPGECFTVMTGASPSTSSARWSQWGSRREWPRPHRGFVWCRCQAQVSRLLPRKRRTSPQHGDADHDRQAPRSRLPPDTRKATACLSSRWVASRVDTVRHAGESIAYGGCH
jgi:hypothetical protein